MLAAYPKSMTGPKVSLTTVSVLSVFMYTNYFLRAGSDSRSFYAEFNRIEFNFISFHQTRCHTKFKETSLSRHFTQS